MSEVLLELVFRGELVPGVDALQARKNVQALFKASPEQLQKMFSGQRIVLRNKLDQEAGNKYLAVLRKNGVVCYLEPMAGSSPVAKTPAVSPSRPASPAGSSSASASTSGPATTPPRVPSSPPVPESVSTPGPATASAESATVLPVAGEKVDSILQEVHWNLDPAGVRLSEAEQVEPPVFDHPLDFDVAPVGTDLADHQEMPPPIVPDVSDISLAPTGSDMGQLKEDKEVVVPDISHLSVEKP